MDFLDWQRRLRPFLRPASAVYERVMASRRTRWEDACSAAFRPSRPCLSVGNIAWGGTGKTPLVDWLLGWSEARGLRAVVLTRGYKAKPPVLPLLAEAGRSAREAGDEPLMLALDHPQSAVVVDPDRRRAGRWAEARLSPDLFLLDDGFQHVKVRRDLDLVALRPDDLRTGWGEVIPAGAWREGPEALERADAFLIKATPEEAAALRPDCERRLSRFGRPLFFFSLRPVELRHVKTGERRPVLSGPYALVSGVGAPAQVRGTVTEYMGRPPAEYVVFADHHAYGPADAARLKALAMPVICTAKDAVKLRALSLENVWALRVEASFGPALWTAASFPHWLEAWAEKEGLPRR